MRKLEISILMSLLFLLAACNQPCYKIKEGEYILSGKENYHQYAFNDMEMDAEIREKDCVITIDIAGQHEFTGLLYQNKAELSNQDTDELGRIQLEIIGDNQIKGVLNKPTCNYRYEFVAYPFNNLLTEREEVAKQAISFSATSEMIVSTAGQLGMIKDKDQYIAEKLGGNNISSFLLTARTISPEYSIRLSNYSEISIYASLLMGRGKSLILMSHVKNIQWEERADRVYGSIMIENPVMAGTFVFIASRSREKWVVDELAIAKRGSEKIEDGFSIILPGTVLVPPPHAQTETRGENHTDVE